MSFVCNCGWEFIFSDCQPFSLVMHGLPNCPQPSNAPPNTHLLIFFQLRTPFKQVLLFCADQNITPRWRWQWTARWPQRWKARRRHDGDNGDGRRNGNGNGDGRCNGNATATEGATATQRQRRQWTARGQRRWTVRRQCIAEALSLVG